MRLSCAVAPAVLFALAGCVPYANVRSAEVRTGIDFQAQSSLTTNSGVGIIGVHGCFDECSPPEPQKYYSLDLSANVGLALPSPAPAVEIGAGLNGHWAYGSVYVQLHDGEQHDYGIGMRSAPSLEVIDQHVYGRYDLTLPSGRRVLWNPGVYYHLERKYREVRMVALVQSVGTEKSSGHWILRPAATLVLARGRYEDDPTYPETSGAEHTFQTAFAVFSVGLVFRSAAVP